MHVDDAWPVWQRARGLSERTIAERVAFLERLPEFTTEAVMSVLSNPALRPVTKATYYGHARAYSRWLVLTDQADHDPLAKLPPPRRPRGVPRPIHDGQLVSVLAAANRRRTRTMILLAALAGLRVHEIAKVHGSDIDVWSGCLTVTGKGGKTALIPLHELLIAESRRYPRNDFWFPSYEAQNPALPHIGRQAVGAAIRDAMRRAGIDATPHQLRHYFATALFANGADLLTVQKLMRHESVQSTQIYTGVPIERLRLDLNRLSLPGAA